MRNSVLIIGVVLILIGIFAYYYGVDVNGVNTFSFRPYSYILVIVGIVLVVLAFIIPTREEMKTETVP